jgi:5-methylthioadenosine/S-adenosylhomocysteine deaminase
MAAEPFDLIVSNGTVLTLDRESTRIDNGCIGIRGDTIAHVGSAEAVPGAAERIDAGGGLILPGLINGHTHAAMTLFRGLADDLPLMEWLTRYIFPAEALLDGALVHAATLLACAEMILGGTTTFCDMYLFEDEVARAAKRAGMRCLVGEVLYDFPSPNYGPVDNGFAYSERLMEKWRGDPLVSVAVEPHSLYTCSADLLQRAAALSRRHGVPLILHLAETDREVTEVRKKFGRRPAHVLQSLGLLETHLIADHCVHLDADEIDVMAAHGAAAIFNPESNMKLASGVAPAPAMIAAGMTVGLGTDGCASNNNLDLMAEMDTAAKLPKVHLLDPTVMEASTVLRMCTCGNAAALGMADRVGTLESGKKADIIVVDTNKPHLVPLYNPYSHLVYAAAASDVRHSVINGRPVMKDRRLLTLDVEGVMDDVLKIADRIKQRFAPSPSP